MADVIRRKTVSGAGRKPRQGVARYPGGQIRHVDRGESEQDVIRVATEARVRQLGVRREEAREPLLGSALGRLKLLGIANGGVSAAQYAAGVRFARCMSLQAILDDVRPAYGVPVLARMSCASGSDPYDRFDPDLAWDANDERKRLDTIGTIRRNAADATSTLWGLERDHPGAAFAVSRVCMWDDLSAIGGSERMLGALRCGLNELARIWQLGSGSV